MKRNIKLQIRIMVNILVVGIVVFNGMITAAADGELSVKPPEEVRIGRSFSVEYQFNTTDEIVGLRLKIDLDSGILFKEIEPSRSCYKRVYKHSDGAEIILIADDYFSEGDLLTLTMTAASGSGSGDRKISVEVVEAVDSNDNKVELSCESFTAKVVQASGSSSELSKSSTNNNSAARSYANSKRSSASLSGAAASKAAASSSAKNSSSKAASKVKIKTQTKSRSKTSVSSAVSDMGESVSQQLSYDHENYDDHNNVEYISVKNQDSDNYKYIVIGALLAIAVIGLLCFVYCLGRSAGKNS